MSKQNTKPSIRCLLCFEGGLDVIKRLLCFKLEAVDYYFSDAESVLFHRNKKTCLINQADSRGQLSSM